MAGVSVAFKTWCGHVPTSTCPQACLYGWAARSHILIFSRCCWHWFLLVNFCGFQEIVLLGHEAKSQHGCSPTLLCRCPFKQTSKQTNNRGFEIHKNVNCYFLQKGVHFLQPDETLQVKLCTWNASKLTKINFDICNRGETCSFQNSRMQADVLIAIGQAMQAIHLQGWE